MTLTRASVLHYWSSRYGPLPVIGGKPTHSRNSAGSAADERGELYDAIVNTPRFSWQTDKSTTANERRAMMLLEQARTNNMPWSVDFSNAAWTKSTMTVTTGIADPKGGTAACTLTATAINAYASQSLAAGASIVRINSLWVRRRTGTGAVRLYNPNGTTALIAPTAEWQRFSAVGTAAVDRFSGIYLDVSGDAVDVYNEQQEDASTATTDIVNVGASATTRAADNFTWAFMPAPQAMMIYVRFVERGTISIPGNAGVMSISDTPPYFLVYVGGTTYRCLFRPAATNYIADVAAGVPVIGDTVELAMYLTSAGSIRIFQSINGAAVVGDSGVVAGAALPAAWGTQKLHAGQYSSAFVGLNPIADIKVVQYADVVASTPQGIMDELRAFELGPNGDVL